MIINIGTCTRFRSLVVTLLVRYINGLSHREDGPAIERSSGTKSWCKNGVLHREDGPAIEWSDGNKEWYINGKLHREDGPAITFKNGYENWYLNGTILTLKEIVKRKRKLVTPIVKIVFTFSVVHARGLLKDLVPLIISETYK
jgi:hypothetical protein